MGLSAVEQMESEEEDEPLPGRGGRSCPPALGGWPLGNGVKERGKGPQDGATARRRPGVVWNSRVSVAGAGRLRGPLKEGRKGLCGPSE